MAAAMPTCLGQLWNAKQLRIFFERVPLLIRVVDIKVGSSFLTYQSCSFCHKKLQSPYVCPNCLRNCTHLLMYFHVDVKVEDETKGLWALAWESASDLFGMDAQEFAMLKSRGEEKSTIGRVLMKHYRVTISIVDGKGPKGKRKPYFRLDGVCTSIGNAVMPPPNHVVSPYDVECRTIYHSSPAHKDVGAVRVQTAEPSNAISEGNSIVNSSVTSNISSPKSRLHALVGKCREILSIDLYMGVFVGSTICAICFFIAGICVGYLWSAS